MENQLFLVQPECKNASGHHLAALCTLADAVPSRRPWYVINRAAKADLGLPEDQVVRHFEGRPKPPLGTGDADAAAIPGDNAFTRELKTLFGRFQPRRGDDVVFMTTCAATVLATARALGELPGDDHPRCHFRFHGDEIYPELEVPAHQWLAVAIARGAPIHLYTDTRAAIREIVHHYDHDPFATSVLPTRWPESETATRPGGTDGDRFTVGILGAMRADKGSHDLAAILAGFFREVRRQDLPVRPAALIQRSDRMTRNARLLAQLAANLGPDVLRLRFLPAGISNEAFVAAVLASDVLLTPGVRDRYIRRISGIAVDAVANGVPFVTTAGTASIELVTHDNGLLASSVSNFSQQLATVARERAAFATAAREAARDARAWRSSELIRRLG